MFQVFRRHSYSLRTRILLSVLIGVFVLFFGGVTAATFLSQPRAVASVDCYSYFGLFTLPGCRTIMPDQIDHEVTNIRKAVENTRGAEAAQLLEAINLREMAVESLIVQTLIERKAHQLGISVSDDDLAKTIESQQAFQINGRFDPERYNQILRDNDLQPAAYESDTRARMLSDTLHDLVTASIDVSPEEARAEFNSFGEKLEVAYLSFPYSNFVGPNPADADIAKFYNENRESFRDPEQVRISFIRYDPAALASQATPSPNDIQEYYDDNLKTLFTHPDQIHVRHILIQVPQEASAAEKAAARVRAEELLQQVRAGKAFGDLAAQYSDDPGSRQNGGDLGFISRGELVKPFEETAFKLKPGESAVAETQFGFHVIQVIELKGAKVDTIEEARPRIVAALKDREGKKTAREDIAQDVAAASLGRALGDIARRRGLVAVDTPYFAQDDTLKGAEDNPKLAKDAFAMQTGDIHPIVDGPVPYLVKLVDRRPSRIPPLAEIRSRVIQTLTRIQGEAAANQAANAVLKQVRSPADFGRVAAARHLEIKTTGEFARAASVVPGLGQFPELVRAVAAAPSVPNVIDHVMVNDGNSYIVEVLRRNPPSDADWKAIAPQFTASFLQRERQIAWGNYLNDLKKRAQIVIHSDMLGGAAGERREAPAAL